MGEEDCLNPTVFGGRYLGMSVDQPQKKGIPPTPFDACYAG